MANYANILLELRENGGKTLYEVAEAVNITPQALSNYERGARVPRDEIKVRLADYYGVTVQQIFFTEKVNALNTSDN